VRASSLIVAALTLLLPLSSARPQGDGLSPLEVEERDRAALEAIGYVSGSRIWLGENLTTGVTQHDPERANEGLNFYTSGHGAVAILMDMSGRMYSGPIRRIRESG
jgi:hypothetical protein